MNDAAIKTTNLTRRFDDLVAVSDLTIEIERGEVFGLLGHNGAGKTTTTRLLNGVLNPTSGSSEVLGFDPATQGEELRQRTGILTENPSLDERLTAPENLRLYADLYGVPEDEVDSRINRLLESFELDERARERIGGYSKGMKQRLALARALLHEPELLFLDEPTSGLDPVAARRVHDLVTRLSADEGRTVILCTHNLGEAQKLCHRVAVLEHGHALAIGTPAELAARMGQRLGLEIEIAAGQRQAAEQAVRAIPNVTSVEANGSIVTVGGVPHPQIPTLIAALVAADVSVYRVMPQEASLEEVYFALHGDALEEEIVI